MTAAQLAALQALLSTGRYAGLDIPDILVRMAEVNPAADPKDVPLPVVTAVNWLREAGLWYAIMAAAQAGNIGAIAAIDLNSDRRTETIDLTKQIIGQMLDAMQTGDHPVQGFDAAARTAFLSLGKASAADLDDLGFRPSPEDLLLALGKPLLIEQDPADLPQEG